MRGSATDELAKLLRKRRLELGYSHQKISDMTNGVIKRRTYGTYEDSKIMLPPPDTLKIIANVLELEYKELEGLVLRMLSIPIDLTHFRPMKGSYQGSYAFNYMVSKSGEVYKPSSISKRAFSSAQLLTPYEMKHGYMGVNVWLSNDSPGVEYHHRLLAMTFLDNPNNLPEVNHIDGNKANNNLSNLEWCSSRDNSIHALDSNLTPSGERSTSSTISDRDAIDIYTSTKTNRELQIIYGLSHAQIKRIKAKTNWTRVIDDYLELTKKGAK